MNREHNTSGDGLGGGVEGGIAFFWHSSEECQKTAVLTFFLFLFVEGAGLGEVQRPLS